MGVSVEGGKGRGKALLVDLNLTPFIDFLSCLLAFLMMTAVWSQIHSIDTEQAVGDPTAQTEVVDPPPPPPLTIRLAKDYVWVARKAEEGKKFPKLGENQDWAGVEAAVALDRTTYPEENQATIYTDDGVFYGEMIQALDISRKYKYVKTALAGGPPTELPATAPAAPAGG